MNFKFYKRPFRSAGKTLRWCQLAALLLAASPALAQPSSTLTVGTGTGTTSSFPIYSCYGYTYSQQIYTKYEIMAANGGQMPATNEITAIRFYLDDLPSSGMGNSTSWVVYMGHKTDSTFSSYTDWVPASQLTEVYNGTMTFPTTTNGQWIEIPLSTSFMWNGTDNIVIAVDENMSGYNCSAYWTFSPRTDQCLVYRSDGTNPDPTSPPSATYWNDQRNNTQFDFVVPPDNAGVDSVFTSESNFCSGLNEVYARIHNYGSNVINSVTVNWTLDGVAQPPVTVSTPIDMENTAAGPEAVITLGVVDFPYNQAQNVVAWTSLPNGNADPIQDNDSTSVVLTAGRLNVDLSVSPQDTAICEGASVTLDAGAHPSNPIYVWNTGALTRTINVTTAGEYWVKVMNSTGCYSMDTVTVDVNPAPGATAISVIDLGGATYEFDVIGATNVATYTWNFGDGSPEETGPGPITHHYTTQGVYGVTLKLGNDCGSVTKSKQVSVPDATGISATHHDDDRVLVYPNPASGLVTVQLEGAATLERIVVYNLLGREVYAGSANGTEAKIDLSHLSGGVYHMVIHTSQGRISQKLSVKP